MEPLKKVLLATLEHEMSEYLSSFIPCLGPYEVEHASAPVEILAKANAFEPTLMILDIDYARDAEYEALTKFSSEHPKTRTLILSSRKEDEPVFKGARYHILLKPFELSLLSQEVKKILPHEDASAPHQEYARLLIADDEEDITELLNDVFKELGIEVHTATDGKQALEIFKREYCNLAIVDLRMPEIDGNQLIEMFESSDHPPKPKFIIILTAALGNTIHDLKRLGYPVIAKPMDVAAVEREVVGACKKHHLAFKK